MKITYRCTFLLPWPQPGRHHVRAADGFYLFDSAKFGLQQQLIEVADNLVQQPQALQSLLVNVGFVVEFLVVGYRGKHDRHRGVTFVVQFLHGTFLFQKVLRYVGRQDVLQQNLKLREMLVVGVVKPAGKRRVCSRVASKWESYD